MNEKDLVKLQQYQQQAQVLLLQKQNIQIQLSEIENALKLIKELKDDEEAYQIVGNVMLKRDPNQLTKELEEKKEMLELRVKTIDKQVDALSKKISEIQEKLSKEGGKNG